MAAIQYTIEFLCLVRSYGNYSFTIFFFTDLAHTHVSFSSPPMCIHFWICSVSILVGDINHMRVPCDIRPSGNECRPVYVTFLAGW